MTTLQRLLSLLLVATMAGCSADMEDQDDLDPPPDEDTVGTDEAPLTGSWDYTAEKADVAHINNRRLAIGRRALNRRACLNSVARGWSEKLAAKGALSHNPNLAAQIDSKCGSLRWRGIAENVGMGATESSIWNAFMGSAAHKANIQNSAWDSVGVGVYKRSDGTLFITQVFADF